MTHGPKARRLARFPAVLDGGLSTSEPASQLLRPQRPLREAAQDARRQTPPSGLGLDSAAVRQRMVVRLREQAMGCEPVWAAMQRVPRHAFVDPALANQAYEDTSLPIGLGQTISKPSVVARMVQLLLQAPGVAARGGHLGRVLEVGTGCGYQAAVLSLLSREVVSIERVRALHDKARDNLAGWRDGCTLRLRFGDGTDAGLADASGLPFDAIISAAGGEAVPPAWLALLAEGGRLVAPVANRKGAQQSLCVVDKANGQIHRQMLEAVHFVPLKSGVQ